jgi:hypothetical protein
MDKPPKLFHFRFWKWLGVSLALLSVGMEVVSKFNNNAQQQIQGLKTRRNPH